MQSIEDNKIDFSMNTSVDISDMIDNNDKLIQVLLAGDDNDIILSTSKGVMSDNDARTQKVGGEVLISVF